MIYQQIQINGGTDALTGKKKKYLLTSSIFENAITYIVSYYETDNTTPAIPAGQNQRQKQAVSSYESRFDIGRTAIDTTTKLFTALDYTVDPSGLPVAGSIFLTDYFANKVVSTYPGTGGSDTTSGFIKGWFKEVMAILELNNQI